VFNVVWKPETHYSSKTVKATDFKFDVHVLRDSADMTPTFFQKAAWPG